MKVAVLASGSKGNSTYIETNNTKVLIDAGMSNLYIEKKLILLGVNPDDINFVFITHTHTDHIAGLKVFIKKHHPKVFLTLDMYNELKDILNDYEILESEIILNDLIVDYFKTSHDTDSVGYIFKSNDKEIVYVTDTGYINIKNLKKLNNKDLYIFESNHDIEMLMNNPNYPYQIKQRILGDKGHLSNNQCKEYLNKIIGDKTKYIVLAHLSEQNNNPSLALNNLNDIENIKIMVATQNESTELIEV